MSLTQVTPDVISTNTISGLISLGFNTLNVANIQVQTVDSGTGNTLVFRANTAERMRITTDGNIGIGTSTPLVSAGYKTITLNDTTGGVYEIRTNGVQSGAFFNDANGARVRALANLIFDSVNTERMRITTTGQVAVSASGSASAPIISKSDDLNTGIFFPAADTIAFSEGGVESMRIDSSGNVGIGTTAPAAKLHILGTYGTTANSGLRLVGSGGTTGDLSPIAFYLQSGGWGTQHQATITAQQVDGTDGGANLVFATATTGQFTPTERMRITAAGLVGIAETSPTHRLHVAGNSGAEVKVSRGTNDFVISLSNNSGSPVYIGPTVSSPLILQTNNTERLRIPSNAGGITFPATQSASSDANTLDDYEEGSWTPGISAASGSGGTVSASNGTYTKIGNTVFVEGNITVNSLGTLSGAFYVTGLPFTSNAGFGQSQGAVRNQGINDATYGNVIVMEAVAGQSFCRFHWPTNTSTQQVVQVASVSTSDFFAFGLFYRV